MILTKKNVCGTQTPASPTGGILNRRKESTKMSDEQDSSSCGSSGLAWAGKNISIPNARMRSRCFA